MAAGLSIHQGGNPRPDSAAGVFARPLHSLRGLSRY